MEFQEICFSIITSGKNRGQLCDKTNCQTHKNKNDIKKTDFNLCPIILTTGKSVGRMCGNKICSDLKTCKPKSIK